MKIKRINIENHFLFAKQVIDFTYTQKDSNGKQVKKLSDLIVFTGVNGIGKTSLIKMITSIMMGENYKDNINYIDNTIEFNKLEFEKIEFNEEKKKFCIAKDYLSRDTIVKLEDIDNSLFTKIRNRYERNIFSEYDPKIELLYDGSWMRFYKEEYLSDLFYNPIKYKIIYIPTDVSFVKSYDKDLDYGYLNKLKSEKYLEIDSDQAVKVRKMILASYNDFIQNGNLEIPQNKTYKTLQDCINAINEMFIDYLNENFTVFELKVKLTRIDLSSGGIYFSNGIRDDIEINQLSSGEQQLFIRILMLKLLDINDAIIIIDEPEILMHVNWQRKLLDVYKKIGKNNQIIIMTHSSLIMESCQPHQIMTLEHVQDGQDKGKVIVKKQT